VADVLVGVGQGRSAMRRAWLVASMLATLCPFMLAVWLASANSRAPS
jgi:hypothetical protein